jgi:hypothetical protein
MYVILLLCWKRIGQKQQKKPNRNNQTSEIYGSFSFWHTINQLLIYTPK